jgi:hypothetical protein
LGEFGVQPSGGGDPEGREAESTSEQKEPLREESPDDARMGRPEQFMLKYLLSWATADPIEGGEEPSFLFGFCCGFGGKLQSLPWPPNIGSCLTGPLDFFSGVGAGVVRISSSA